MLQEESGKFDQKRPRNVDGVTYPWNAVPISVRKTSRFLPLRFALAASRTFSSRSQQAKQGSVFTRANERSSLRGLKSVRFCFASCVDSQLTTAVVYASVSCSRQVYASAYRQ